VDAAWFLAWAALSSVWCVTAASRLGATFDEPVYVARGLERWRTGSTAGLMQLGTMPLPVDVETLPLYLWERAHGVRLDPVEGLGRLLPWARAGALPFWWLLLWYAGRAGRSLAGPWGGCLAVAVLACEPTLLAHAGLATTDVAVTACLLAFVYHFRAGREGPWRRRVGWPAVWFAAAVLAKASGLVFGVLCMGVLELERRLAPVGVVPLLASKQWHGPGAGWRAWWAALWRRPARGTFRGDLFQTVGLGLALVFVYCGSDWRPQASAVEWAHSLPDGGGKAALAWAAEHACVFSNAGEGLVRQVTHNVRGHGVYILGRTDPRSLWYYFPAALSVKLSEPLLLAPVLLLAVRARALCNWAALSALALLAFSLTCRVQIGVRLMFPLAALAAVGVSAAAVTAVRTCGPGWRARAGAAACAAAVLWSGGSAWNVWPDGLCYVNRLWGGPDEGYRLVSDSNYDWGQGLKELAAWQRREGVPELDVWYFGADPAVLRPTLRPAPLHALPIRRPEDVLKYVRGRRLAVGVSCAYGAAGGDAARCAREFLARRRPAARTSTFLIYDFTHEGAEPRPSGSGEGAGTSPAP
jgi:hypothetical protein